MYTQYPVTGEHGPRSSFISSSDGCWLGEPLVAFYQPKRNNPFAHGY